jgi:hypothetical protein
MKTPLTTVRKSLIPCLACVLLWLAVPAIKAGPISYVVVPNNRVSTVGNLVDWTDGALDFIVQQIHGRGQFPDGNLWITEFAFRMSPNTGSSTTSADKFDVYLSTSPFAPNSFGMNKLITPVFADNRGPDHLLVRSGPANWSSPGCTGTAPCPFDLIVAFDRPFLFNRKNGALLLELRIAGLTGTGGGIDAVSFDGLGGSMAVVVGYASYPSGEVDLTGDIVRFGYHLQVVPEPGAWTLVGLGVALMAVLRRNRPGKVTSPGRTD